MIRGRRCLAQVRATEIPRTYDVNQESTQMADTNSKLFLTAPAGNICKRAGALLVERGQSISVLALERDVELLPDAVREAAEIHVGSMANEADVVAAGHGATAMLLNLPPVLFADDALRIWDGFIANSLAAIKANKIERVVFISGQGAEPGTEAGLMRMCYEVEELLRSAAPNVRALRAGPLMENFINEVEPLSHGILPVVNGPDIEMSLVAAADVGDVAAELLADDSWSGFEVIPVRGPEVLSTIEIAKRMSAVLGLEITAVPITSADVVEEMTKFGLARGAAEEIAAVFEIGAGLDNTDTPTTRVTTTSLDTFVSEQLAPIIAEMTAKSS